MPQRCQSKSHQTTRCQSETMTGAKQNYGRGKKVVVVGAGPGGLLTALLLAQRGYQVDIHEKRPEPDAEEKQHGSRSIVFGLLPRGQKGLRQAGIRLPERGQSSIWLNGLGLSKGAYRIVNRDGKVTESFSPLPPSVLLVERAALVEHMMSELKRLEPDRISLHYGSSLTHLDLEKRHASFEGSAAGDLQYDLLVGCDGRRSSVRGALEAKDPSMHHEAFVSDRSYQGFHRLPPLDSVDTGDETGIPIAFHLSGDGKTLFNATFWPTRYGTISGNVAAPSAWYKEHPNTEETYLQLFAEHFPNFPKQWVPEICRQLVEAKSTPNGASVKCSKLHGPSTVILGDAAHGVTPALGQGCNAALESAEVLAKVLDEADGNADVAAPLFTEARLADAHALFHLDRNARSITGLYTKNLTFWAVRFHLALGMALKKILPQIFKGPAYANIMGEILPYSKIYGSIQRDKGLLICLVCLAAAGLVAAVKTMFGF